MFISLAFLSFFVSSITGFDVSSESGRKLMANARALANNNNNNNQQYDYSWVQAYSVKFQSCHTMTQFDISGNQNMEPLVKAQVVKFKLCAAKECSDKCVGGDYIVSASYFADAYTENMMNANQYTCEAKRETCNCNNDDGYNTCLTTCYQNAGLNYCIDLMQQETFNVQKYLTCNKVKIQNNNNNQNNGENNNNNNNNNNNVYYVAPKCSSSGDSINLVMYTDQYCSVEASSDAYAMFKSSYGIALPYTTKSLVGSSCVECAYANANNGQYQISEMCDNLYTSSAKCEVNLPIKYPDNKGCYFMSEVPAKSDGYTVKKSKAPVVAGIFIASTIGLAIFAGYLFMKSSRSINLSS